MLRVLIVDDEPFIARGLSVLIDWEKEGFEVAAICGDGRQALEYLREQPADLILADIRMPVMDGLELLEQLRRERLSDAWFVILSGYSDFGYAQRALRSGCMDYIVKPVEREELLAVVRKAASRTRAVQSDARQKEEHENAYFAQTMRALLAGRFDRRDADYVRSRIRLSQELRYVAVETGRWTEDEEESEFRSRQRKLCEACREALGSDADHLVVDAAGDERSYGVGLIWCDGMAEGRDGGERAGLDQLARRLADALGERVSLLAGKRVSGLENIARSYTSAHILRSFEGFREPKRISFYEEELQVHSNGVILCKESLDALLAAIGENDTPRIRSGIETLYEDMGRTGLAEETVRLNLHYLLFQLIHIAAEQDGDVNQEEILHYISESSISEGTAREGSAHLYRFACEYAEYLAQLRQKSSNGVLNEIEREIRENYAENLSLRNLGRKYYINSSYLGQLFHRAYGVSFKDFLTRVRIEEAARLLRTGDEPVGRVAELTGYRDCDYFIRKFIEHKGCTPSRYRRNQRSGSPQ